MSKETLNETYYRLLEEQSKKDDFMPVPYANEDMEGVRQVALNHHMKHKEKVRGGFIRIRNVIQNCANLETELVKLFIEDIDEEIKELRL